MNEDFLLDEDDDIESQYYLPVDDDDEGDEEDLESNSDLVEDSSNKSEKIDSSTYVGKISQKELWLSSAYDDIIASSKSKNSNPIEDAAVTLVKANPKHTSAFTVNNIVKELLHRQGHSRMVNSVYTPDTPLTGRDVDLDFKDEDDSGFNRVYTEVARDQISRFVEYLATRDLSKDSVISRRRKQRHIPAFIILLFSSGLYDLIIECPTMPEEYADQISSALRRIMKSKYDIVEELAKKYESMNRDKVAERVRKMQLSWFFREPAEIRTAAEYNDLDLNHQDVIIYREYRSKFTNMSRTITQDIISDMIEVVIDKDSGIYEKLKDKTRSEAISDVKQVYSNWSKSTKDDLELTTKVIYKDFPEITEKIK